MIFEVMPRAEIEETIVAQLADISHDLCALGTPNGSDWTTAFQSAIDAGYTHIYISKPISISTVNIPVNRPINISASNYINITGTPLITILSGGSGFNFNGSGGSLCTGVILNGLSFTSNNVAVNSAIKSTGMTGFFFSNLYFGSIAGSAIQATGVIQDGGLENIHMMDCGSSTNSVFQIGDSSSDANRVSTRNLRIERSSGLMLDIQGSAYAIEFQDTKLHGSSNGKGLLSTASGTYGIRFNGGQFEIASATDTITLDGIGNMIEGVTFTSDGTTDISGAITIKGTGNKITRNTIKSLYGKVIEIDGESHDFVGNILYGSGWVNSTAPFVNISDNHFIASSVTTGMTSQMIVTSGTQVTVKGNKCKNAASLDAFIGVFSGTAATIRDNYDFGSNFAHMVDTNSTESLIDNNMGANSAGTINDTSGGTTNISTNNRQIT